MQSEEGRCLREAAFDGVNIFPVLEQRAGPIERTLFWWVGGGRQQQAVRSGDWKLIFDQVRPMLYDVRTDLGERTDLIGTHPEIAKRVRPLLERWQNDVDAEAKSGVH